jgi:hypothetical protein
MKQNVMLAARKSILKETKSLLTAIKIGRVRNLLTFHWKAARVDLAVIYSIKSYVLKQELELERYQNGLNI